MPVSVAVVNAKSLPLALGGKMTLSAAVSAKPAWPALIDNVPGVPNTLVITYVPSAALVTVPAKAPLYVTVAPDNATPSLRTVPLTVAVVNAKSTPLRLGGNVTEVAAVDKKPVLLANKLSVTDGLLSIILVMRWAPSTAVVAVAANAPLVVTVAPARDAPSRRAVPYTLVVVNAKSISVRDDGIVTTVRVAEV